MGRIHNKHYIDVDAKGRILDGWSDGPHHNHQLSDKTILLTDHGGYQFRLFPGGEENPALSDIDGIPLYKWVDGQAVLRTEDEIAADRAAIPELPPTAQERLEAQVIYTAIMTDTFIGERTSGAASETPAEDGDEGCGAREDEMTDTLLDEEG